MHIKDEFDLRDVDTARGLVRAHPFATIVGPDLRATHMPALVDEEADELAVLCHIACADPAVEVLDGPVLMVFHGVHGYISASWYASETIPTWNNVTLHVRGTPERFDDAMPVLRATVDHFESAVAEPWSLDRLGETAREMADSVVAFRLRAESWHVEAKLSQDKPCDERSRLVEALQAPGPYRHPQLAAAMRRLTSAS